MTWAMHPELTDGNLKSMECRWWRWLWYPCCRCGRRRPYQRLYECYLSHPTAGLFVGCMVCERCYREIEAAQC